MFYPFSLSKGIGRINLFFNNLLFLWDLLCNLVITKLTKFMKITLLGRNLFLAVAMLATALTFNSCRKELLVQSPDNLKNALSIAEAKSYFNAHLANSKKVTGGLFALSSNPTLQTIFANKQPVWDKAYQKMISTGGAVKIPLDFGNVMQMVDSKKKSIVPLASLNYLLMYKDNKDVVHAEWVHLRPTKSWIYGKRQVYNGTVEIRDWEGKRLKTYRYGTSIKTGKNIKGMSVKSEEEEEEESEEVEDCYRIPNGQCPKEWPCTQTSCDLCLAHCAFDFCYVYEPDCEDCDDPPFNPYTPPGGGETGDPGGSGGGGTGNGNGEPDPNGYPPNCNPDPGYVVPDYPAPEGTEWILPCGDVPIPEVPDGNDPYEGIDLSPEVRSLAGYLGLNGDEAGFLEANPNIFVVISGYVTQNPSSVDADAFAKWAVKYLYINQLSINISQFLTEFFSTGPELVADPNADNWTDPDNEILFDPDQIIYQQYQDNQPWPTVNRDDVIPFEKFVKMRKKANHPDADENCLVLAKEQLGMAGYTCSGYLPGSQTFSIYTEQNGVDLSRTKQAISYIISALSQKIPVLIGVDNRNGTPSPKNLDGSTDHFVVIVGMGTDENGKYFQFVDNATSDRSTGASYSNRLYYNSTTGKITGKTAITGYRNLPGMRDYVITQVRKSIKK